MLLDSFLAGFGGVGGFCAVVTLVLRLWSGAFEALANSLYAHVSPEKLPYASDLLAVSALADVTEVKTWRSDGVEG